ncbi:hypothetical protein DBB34_14620 [Sphaerisporangium cinnabarinum]|nr:hypothetical protein [Sphaerisporangium cinnabarinum]PTU55386.1 hypothetical protein DBB34_14620 [Sphaerisporangium cinnabarinum]
MSADEREVSEEFRQRLVAAATFARSARYILERLGDPIERSPLWFDDEVYPWEKPTAWIRNYLSAGLDHLDLYANVVAPLKYYDGMELRIAARPYFTLGRSAIESTAQAAWVMAGGHVRNRVIRHLRLLWSDLDEQAKVARAASDTAGAVRATQRQESIVARMDERGVDSATYSCGAPNYLDMIKGVASSLSRTPAELEVLWRTASAAAHGKNWFTSATHDVELLEEYEPGYFRVRTIPREDDLAEVEETAARFAFGAVCHFANGLGADHESLVAEASVHVFKVMPVRPGAEDVVEGLIEDMRRRFDDGSQGDTTGSA